MLIWASVFIFISYLTSSVMIVANKQKTLTLITAISAMANVILNFYFIPKYGIFGAAWTTIISEVLVAAWTLLIVMDILSQRNCIDEIYSASTPKVFAFIPRFHPIYSGQAYQLLELAKKWQSCGASIKIITFGEENDNTLIDNISVLKIKADCLGGDIKSALKFACLLINKASQYDNLFLISSGYSTDIGIIIAKLLGKKVFYQTTLIGSDDHKTVLSRGKLKFLRRIIYQLVDYHICISPKFENLYIQMELPEKKMLLLPNGVDIDKFSPTITLEEKRELRSSLDLPEDKTIIAYVGSIIKRKGVDMIIEIWNELKYNNICLLLIGPLETPLGEEPVNILSLIDSQNVIFTNRVNNVEQYLKSSDIFLFPSRREGMPQALLEAMATALPVVASDLPGIKDYLIYNNKNGIIVPVDNTREFIIAVNKLLNDKYLANTIGKEARNTIMDRFSIGKISESYLELFSKNRDEKYSISSLMENQL